MTKVIPKKIDVRQTWNNTFLLNFLENKPWPHPTLLNELGGSLH